jgi:hypothetical protein
MTKPAYDKPEHKKQPMRREHLLDVGDPQSTTPPTTLNNGQMFACGRYEPRIIDHITAEIRVFDDSLPVASTMTGGLGGGETGATLDSSSKKWFAQFSSLVENTDSSKPYRLKVRFYEASNVLNTLITVLINLSSTVPVHHPTC